MSRSRRSLAGGALVALLLASFLCTSASGQRLARRAKPAIGSDVKQLVVTVADGWGSTGGKMQCFQRGRGGEWRPVFTSPAPVLLGRSGLAWGRGVLSGEGRAKVEGDGRAPAGVFRIGKVFGEAATLPEGASYPYLRKTKWDVWSDDPKHPYYNRHIRVDPAKGVPPWFEKSRMRLGDDAYYWLIEIRHNADPPVPGMGSAIFLHTRRGPDRKTAGCTTMKRGDLESVIRFLRAPAKPHYVLLPRAEYEARKAAWGLPDFPG